MNSEVILTPLVSGMIGVFVKSNAYKFGTILKLIYFSGEPSRGETFKSETWTDKKKMAEKTFVMIANWNVPSKVYLL